MDDVTITADAASAGMGGSVDAGGWGGVDLDPMDTYSDWWGSPGNGNSSVALDDWSRNSTGGSAASVAPGASGGSWFDWSNFKKWITEGTGKDGKGPSILSMAMPTLVSGVLSAGGELLTGAKKEARELAKRKVNIDQQVADANTAKVAQTSYGNSMPTIKRKSGLINTFHPVTVQHTGAK